MSARLGMSALALLAVFTLSACEKPQTVTGDSRKADTPVWQASNNRWSLHDFKAGDQASWERQMAARAQNQNDYSRNLDR
jgi:hypothetical protein